MTEQISPQLEVSVLDDFGRAKIVAGGVTATLASFFSTAIRSVKLEYLRSLKNNWNPEKVWESCGFLIGVSPTVKTALYHAAVAFYPDELKKISTLTPKNLTLLFNPDDLCAIIGLVYTHRSLKKHFDPTGWRRVEEDAFTAMLIASAVGETVQHMSRGDAMLQGGLRVLAQAALNTFGKDLPPVTKTPLAAKTRNKQSSPEQREVARYGCSHLQVTAQIAQTLGFGSDIGLCIAASAATSLPEYLKRRAAAWAAARTISDSFQAFGHAPEVSEDSELYLSSEENESLTSMVNKLLEVELPKYWISAKPEDLPPEIREALQLDAKRVKASGSLEDEIPADAVVSVVPETKSEPEKL